MLATLKRRAETCFDLQTGSAGMHFEFVVRRRSAAVAKITPKSTAKIAAGAAAMFTVC